MEECRAHLTSEEALQVSAETGAYSSGICRKPRGHDDNAHEGRERMTRWTQRGR